MDLFNPLPDSVEIGGRSYRINTDYRYGIKAESILTDPDRTNAQKVKDVIELYFNEIPDFMKYADETVKAVIWFYTGKEYVKESSKTTENDGKKEPRHFSFEHDSGLIYAAFLQQYGVDLSSANMHWWKFKSMFNALSEDTQFAKVIHIRAVEITSKMSREQKDYYKKMKKLYALPAPTEEQRKIDFITEALLNGESLDGITERYYQKYGKR